MDGFSISGRGNGVGISKDFQSLPINDNSVGKSNGPSFSDTLSEAIGNVNELQKASDQAIQNLATGKTDNVAEVMVAAEKADIALKVMVQVRNKIIDAYQEIMKMQV